MKQGSTLCSSQQQLSVAVVPALDRHGPGKRAAPARVRARTLGWSTSGKVRRLPPRAGAARALRQHARCGRGRPHRPGTPATRRTGRRKPIANPGARRRVSKPEEIYPAGSFHRGPFVTLRRAAGAGMHRPWSPPTPRTPKASCSGTAKARAAAVARAPAGAARGLRQHARVRPNLAVGLAVLLLGVVGAVARAFEGRQWHGRGAPAGGGRVQETSLGAAFGQATAEAVSGLERRRQAGR